MSPDLPLLERYLARALPEGGAAPARVRLCQEGEMRLRPGARPRRFAAEQEASVLEVAFDWRARFPVAPLLALRVVDRFAAGEGSLEARLLGLRAMRQAGPETSLGEAMRYLAELPWVPHALALNPHLERRAAGERAVEVSTLAGGRRAAVTLEFGADGDVAGSRAEARPYKRGKAFVPMPWSGSFSDYGVLGGVRLPRRAEARWELPEGPFTYWRGEITSFELVPAP